MRNSPAISACQAKAHPCLRPPRTLGKAAGSTTWRSRASPRAPRMRPARTSAGGTWSMPLMKPLATAGAAPSTIIKMMAFQFTPNTMTPSGYQSTEGMVCMPVISDADAGPQDAQAGHGGAHDGADDDDQCVPDDSLLGGGPAGLPERAGAEELPQLAGGRGR